MKNIYIVGAGGHAKVVADIILKRKKLLGDNIKLIGFLDDNYKKDIAKKIFGKKVVGEISKIEELSQDKSNEFVIAIGNNNIRENIVNQYEVNYYTAIHPSAIIGAEVTIEAGTVIMANVVINPYTDIGRHCIINTGVIIEHDNNIADFVHISPKAATAGGVWIGRKTWIGMGSLIIQNIKIGKEVLIGAGSVVVKDINAKVKAYGNPCREIEKR